MIRKNIILLVLTVLVYGWFLVTHQKVPTMLQVLGVNTNISLYVEPEVRRDPIVESIDGAKSEVLVEVYLLSDKQVVTALEDARSRGLMLKLCWNSILLTAAMLMPLQTGARRCGHCS